MNSSKSFDSKKLLVKTKSTISFGICFLIILLYVLLWILGGEFNLLNLKWFDNVNYSFNLNLLYWSLGIMLFSILLFIILYFTKVIKLDLIPFLLMSNTIGVVTIFSAGIPIPKGNDSAIYIVMARFFIVIASSLIVFFVSNSFVLKMMLNSPYAHEIYQQYKDDLKETQKIKKEINETKNKDSSKTYIDITEEE